MNLSKDKATYDKLSREDALDLVHVFIEKCLDSSYNLSSSRESFELPAWSEYQAHELGQQKAFRKLLNFIKR